VYQGTYRSQEVAVKVVEVDDASKQDESKVMSVLAISMLASTTSPYICRLHGVCWLEDEVWIVMERCQESLFKLVQRGDKAQPGLPAADVAAVGLELCDALRAVHGTARALHLDIKPDNILVADDGSLRLIDFGIARRLETRRTALTITSVARGSSVWASPEQHIHGRASKASDIYSLGVTLFFCITGFKPSNNPKYSPSMCCSPDHITGPASVQPPTLRDIIYRMTANKPADRPALQDVEQALHAVLAAEEQPPRYIHFFWGSFSPLTKVQSPPLLQ
jgi:eukaryotic-like serine/threonine-protein kinase